MKKLLISLMFITLILTGCTPKEEFTITFEGYGGLEPETALVKDGKDASEPTEPSRMGYTFDGWYSDIDLTEVYAFDVPITEDTSIYAKWLPHQSTLHLISEIGGYTHDMELFYYDWILLPIFEEEGYIFRGWYTEPTFENKVQTHLALIDDKTVYARWEEIGVIDIPDEGVIDITTLPYYEYMNSTNPIVTIEVLNIGAITIELFPSVAPNTVNNFISYIQDSEYDLNSFHRVIDQFMIQGGSEASSQCPIAGEFSVNDFTNDLLHYRGVLSMARTDVKDSATTQFFVVHKDSHYLDTYYAAFGGVISGFNILDYIAGVNTDANDAPYTEVIIESITVNLRGYVPTDPVCAD